MSQIRMKMVECFGKALFFAAIVSTAVGAAGQSAVIPPEPQQFSLESDEDLPQPTKLQGLAAGEPSGQHASADSDKHISEVEISLVLPRDDNPPNPPYLAPLNMLPNCDCRQGLRYSVHDPALGFCYHPLYFEHIALERLGHSRCPFDSTLASAHFFGNLALLPVKVVRARPHSRWPSWNRPSLCE